MNADVYVFGDARVPPWVGDALEDVEFLEDRIYKATVRTSIGKKPARVGDRIMRINGVISLLSKQDADKYKVK